jgi:hypothetical protein
MNIKVGDYVKLLKEKGEGVVSKVLSESKIEVLIDDFPIIYNIEDLITVNDENNVQVFANPTISKESLADKVKISTSINVKADMVSTLKGHSVEKNCLIADLHYSYLMEYYQVIDKNAILDFQISYVKKLIELFLQKSYKSLTLIHGFGEGKLRKNIHDYINSVYPNLEVKGSATEKHGLLAASIVYRKKKH